MNTDTSVSEIADLVGFQSIHYFSRFFKAKENCTPMEYRMRNGQSRYFSFQRQGGSNAVVRRARPRKKKQKILDNSKSHPAVSFYNEAVDKQNGPERRGPVNSPIMQTKQQPPVRPARKRKC